MKKFLFLIFILAGLTACDSAFDSAFDECIDDIDAFSEDKTSYYVCSDKLFTNKCYFLEESEDHTKPIGYDGDWPAVTYIADIYDSYGNFIDQSANLDNASFSIFLEENSFELFKSNCKNINRKYFLHKTEE